MSRTAHKLLSASGGKAYEIGQSLVFDRGDGAYLVRAAADITDGNHTTFTYSTWFKRVQTGSNDIVFNVRASNGAGVTFMVYIPGTEQALYVFQKDSGGNTLWYLETNRKLRDVGAWYHIVVAVDTTQSTASDRVKIYINGTQETSFTGSSSYPDEDLVTPVNDGVDHQIGYNAAASLDGYMAETYLIDGTAQAASAFGETDSETNAWIPKKYGGAYGTNGFYLKYVSGAIGTDSSGEGNNYTASNLANSDVMLDTPTNNYPTINSLTPYNTTISNLSQGNLHVKAVTYDSGYYGNHIATVSVPESGKWYIETRMAVESGTGNISWIGVMPQTLAIIPKDGTGATDGNYAANSSFTGMVADLISGVDTIRLFDGGSAQATISSATATSYIIALALDVDNNKVYGGYDSGSGITWLASGDPAAGSNGQSHTFTSETIIQLQVGPNSGSNSNSKQTLNFGQNGTFCGNETAGGNSDSAGEGNFFYAPPSGFKALCSKNLPTSTIKLPKSHFNTVLYTGDGNDNRGVSGLGFSPDFVWIKNRSNAYSHMIYDRLRGAGNYISSDVNNVEASGTHMNSFDSDGFSVTRGSSSRTNENGQTYVAWNWKANGSGSANTDGSINTTATSVNTTAGFSISNYQGTGSNATVGHGLGVAPSLIILKNRDTDDNWRVYSRNDATDYLALNWDGGSTDDNTSWNDTAPTSSVFSIGTDTNTNRSGDDFIAYCFAEVEGFSKFGVYEANGNVNGPFIHTGFTPSWIIFKYIDGSGEWWWMLDSTRDTINPTTEVLYTNATSAEGTIGSSGGVDFLSNGFKIRATNGGINSANTYFYMAFAEFPFKYANAR
jgi:hypothetical protein